MFQDAFAYLATTPSYVGGPMSYGWATDDTDFRHLRQNAIEHRYAETGCFPTRYWRPDVHVAAFALPNYVLELVEASLRAARAGQLADQRAAIGVEGGAHVVRA